MLVNIQNSAEFDSQVLNRDIWKNEQVGFDGALVVLVFDRASVVLVFDRASAVLPTSNFPC